MNATLYDLLNIAGFTAAETQEAMIYLLLTHNCFSKPSLRIDTDLKHCDQASAHYKSLVKAATCIWDKLPKMPEEKKVDATSYLKIQFPNLEDGLTWLSSILDIKFLRKTFFDEGIGKDKEITQINTYQWKHMRPDSKSQNSEWIKKLNFTNSSPWPTQTEIKNVVVLSSLHEQLKERIDFIPETFSGNIYVLSGHRGLFKFEPVAPILANWFKMPDKVNVIQEVLNKLSPECEWTQDLSKLKQHILKSLNVSTWPEAKESYYYANKEVYDNAAKIANREPLNILGGPWPVVADLVAFYLQQKKLFSKIKLIPISTLGKNKRIPGYTEMIFAWYEQVGKALLLTNQKTIFLTCNATHSIPYVIQNIAYQSNIQDTLIARALSEKVKKLLLRIEIQNIDTKMQNIIVCGPPNKDINLEMALDRISKMFYIVMQENPKKLIAYYEARNELNSNEIPSVYARRMIFHNYNLNIQLAEASIDFAYTYKLRQKDHIKIAGLINFAINVLNYLNDSSLDSLIQDIKYLSYINIADFIQLYSLTPRHWQSSPDAIQEICNKNKKTLNEIRRKIYLKLCNFEGNPIFSIYKLIFKRMKLFHQELLIEINKLLGYPENLLTFAFLGSYSRMLATPWSDIEFFILTNTLDSHIKKYAEILTKVYLLFIINLGETLLPKLAVTTYDYKKQQSISLMHSLYDSVTPQGLAFDSNKPQGQMTPLGNGVKRLIGTPKIFAEQSYELETFSAKYYAPCMLSMPVYIAGNEVNFSQFLKYINLTSWEKRHGYALIIFENDFEKYSSLMKRASTATYFASHDAFYRPVTQLIDNLIYPLKPPKYMNPYEKVYFLFSINILNWQQLKIITSVLNFSSYVRLVQHVKLNQATVRLSVNDNLQVINDIKQSQKRIMNIYSFFHNGIRKHQTDTLLKNNQLAKEVSSKLRVKFKK